VCLSKRNYFKKHLPSPKNVTNFAAEIDIEGFLAVFSKTGVIDIFGDKSAYN